MRQAAELAARSSSAGSAAWVFGTEKHGLTVEDLRLCHQIARIPAPGPSLNLAQAVGICLYESRVACDTADGVVGGVVSLASLLARTDLSGWLQALGVARERDAASKVHTLRRLASRLELDEHEAALLRAIVARVFAEM